MYMLNTSIKNYVPGFTTKVRIFKVLYNTYRGTLLWPEEKKSKGVLYFPILDL